MGDEERDVGGVSLEQPAVRTTIVGGRPPGSGKGVGSVPRGIEVLVKKAAVDPEFRALMLAERSAAAAEIGLALNEAEAAILNGVPQAQLEAIIANTTISPKIRPAFMGRAAAVMLAALGVGIAGAGCSVNDNGTAGIRPDDGPTITGPEDITEPEGAGTTLGSRPDKPERTYGVTDYGSQASYADTGDAEYPVK
jgi:hypothetical protein